MNLLLLLCLLTLCVACSSFAALIEDGDKTPPPPSVPVEKVHVKNKGKTIQITLEAHSMPKGGSFKEDENNSYMRVYQANKTWSPEYPFSAANLSQLESGSHQTTMTLNTNASTTVDEPITVHYILIYSEGGQDHTIDTKVVWTHPATK